MTKLDGTARGGILVAIAAKHKLPVHFIGVGEGIDDLVAVRGEGFRQGDRGIGMIVMLGANDIEAKPRYTPPMTTEAQRQNLSSRPA